MEYGSDVEAPAQLGLFFVGLTTAAITLVGAVAWGVVTLVFNTQLDWCPDGGDEIWHRRPASAYAPEAMVAVVAVVLLAVILRAAVGGWWGLAMAAASVGSAVGYLTLDQYLSHVNEPAAYRCGEVHPGAAMPTYVAPALVLVYALVIASYRAYRRDR